MFNFEVGTFVFTKDNDRMMYIQSVCDCPNCIKRGFGEPYATRFRLGELPLEDYIAIYEKDALIDQISKVADDVNDEDVQRFFENARTVALTEVDYIIEQCK